MEDGKLCGRISLYQCRRSKKKVSVELISVPHTIILRARQGSISTDADPFGLGALHDGHQ